MYVNTSHHVVPEVDVLMLYYNVKTLDELIKEQYFHIMRLQLKLAEINPEILSSVEPSRK